ncbi:MAG TPA: hypothetical protein DCO82_02120 [Alphaproteobacteria bacterium]|jgi:zinc/manganese transport system permease protein|nr:hypothetical protein [Alphaproteobacteria bacterium]
MALSAEMIGIVGPALAAGFMIILIHVPLGIAVLRRGIIFIDLAIAQIAGLGALVMGVTWEASPWWSVQMGALFSAFTAAYFFHLVERYAPERQEAVIGCGFVLAASTSILILSGQPHGDETLEKLLSGQLLFAGWEEILVHAPVYLFIFAVWFLRPHMRQGIWFYLLFSTAITSSVQLAGVFVVFSSLIAPALGAARFAKTRMELAIAYGVALTGLLSGFGAALWSDLPLGPVLVCCFMLAALAAGIWPVRRVSEAGG